MVSGSLNGLEFIALQQGCPGTTSSTPGNRKSGLQLIIRKEEIWKSELKNPEKNPEIENQNSKSMIRFNQLT